MAELSADWATVINFGQFFLTTETAQICFQGKRYEFVCADKNELGTTLGDHLTNSSGHPEHNVPVSGCQEREWHTLLLPGETMSRGDDRVTRIFCENSPKGLR
jgi:hypothetical protein